MKAVAYLLFAVILAGCAQPVNPSFPVTSAQARQAISDMDRNPRSLARPVVIISGFADPGFALLFASDQIRKFAKNPRIISVSIGFDNSFEQCRKHVIDAVQRACPNKDPHWTVPVDVIGMSLGGVVARYAAAPHDRSPNPRRLNIISLFTISSPHRGATLANAIALTDFQRDIRTQSGVLDSLSCSDAQAGYELFPYVLLGDEIVGDRNAAPPGRTPLWLSNPPLSPPHLAAMSDDWIWSDIARRLRGEPPFSHFPPAPFPQ